MTAITDAEYSISATGDIRATSPSSNHTVLELYEWVRGKGSDLVATGDDLFDITDADIAEKKFETIINLLGTTNIDYVTSKTLYGGSIVQANGVIYDGISVIAPAGTAVDIIQNGAKLTDFWGTSLNADSAKGISHKFLIQVASGGIDIDNRVLIGQARTWQSTYAEFVINGTSRGENSLPLDNAPDLNNQSTTGSISAMNTIVVTEGYTEIDVEGSGSLYPFYIKIDRAARSMNDTYERMKYLTRSGTAANVCGLSGDLFRGITHELAISVTAGVFTHSTLVSWGTGLTAGTGQILAINTAKTKMWIQKITGVDPTSAVTLTETANTATISAVTARPISKPFVGASTGTAIVGAYGVGYSSISLSAIDKLTDLSNTPRQPPNLATGKVSGLDSASTVTILVAKESTATPKTFNTTQLTVASVSGSTLVVTEALVALAPPATGTVRFFDGTSYQSLAYTAVDTGTKTFTTASPVPVAITVGKKGFISYIDYKGTGVAAKQFQTNYTSDLGLLVQVRYIGSRALQTFVAPVTFTITGFDISALQLDD